MTVGDKIKQLRQRSGLTQESIAVSLGVTRQAVAKWESNQTAPSTANLLKLAELFSVSLQKLTNINADTANMQEYILRKKRGEDERNHLLEQVKQVLFSVLWVVLSYASISLLYWFGIHFLGVPDYIWTWVIAHYAICLAGCISVVSMICSYSRFSWALFFGTTLGIVFGNIAGKITTAASPLRFNDGWMVYLLGCWISVVIGVLFEARVKKRSLPSCILLPNHVQKALTTTLVVFIIIVSIVSCYASTKRLSFNHAAEEGYQSGLNMGTEDAMAGKSMDKRFRGSYVPEKYPFGSAANEGFSIYWPSGYTEGYSIGSKESN